MLPWHRLALGLLLCAPFWLLAGLLIWGYGGIYP
jgi:hypothetical protein